MQVRLLRQWRGRKIGRVYAEMPDGLANLLVRRGIAEEDVDHEEHGEQRERVQQQRRHKRRRR